MDKLDHRKLTLIKRAAEDAIHACNRHYAPFVDVVAHPLNIIALVEMAQSRQAEFEAMTEALLNQTQLLAKKQAEVEEKDKRINELERSCNSYKNQRDDNAQKLMVKSVHYSSIQEELAKLKDRLELAHHLASQSAWSSLKQLRKVVKALRGEHE